MRQNCNNLVTMSPPYLPRSGFFNVAGRRLKHFVRLNYRSLQHTDLDTLDMAFDRIKDEYDSLYIAYRQAIGTGPKQIIASQIRDADIRMNIVCNAALLVIQNDTLAIDWDLTRDWLDRKNSFSSDIEIATTFLSEDDESSFHSFVSTIPGRRSLTADDITDYELFVDLTSLLLDAKAEERADSELDSLEVESLEDIAEDNDRMVAGMAKGILETFYGYTFADTITMRSTQEQGASDGVSLTQVQVFPQPFMEEVHFQFPTGHYELRILNMIGSVIGQMDCENCDKFSWHSNRLPEGVYIYELFSDQMSHSGLLLKLN